MDPDATYEEMTRLLSKLLSTPTREVDFADLDRLGELFTALDTWIRRGGFLPAPWQASRNALVRPMVEMRVADLEARLDILCDLVRAVSAELARRAHEPLEDPRHAATP